jgi:anthranilate/para-aminobenzoate synthase component II
MPLLGICFGHQLLCWTYGAVVESLPTPINRFEKIKIIKAVGIFEGLTEGQTIPLAENHNDYVLKNSLDKSGFDLLASSSSCGVEIVEAVKHKIKPFIGVQFHPERIRQNGETHPEGDKIIENFYKNLGIMQ